MNTKNVKVWDLPTRLFHWTLVTGIVFMWFSAEISDSLMDWHIRVGQFLLALVLFRLIWGCVGSESARFTSFLRSPKSTLTYAKTLTSKQPSWHNGHNPLGGWMVIAILLILLLQTGSGLFATDDVFAAGPLYELVSEDLAYWLTGIHELLFHVLTGLIILHIGAISFYWFYKRTNLVRAMLGGSAALPLTETIQDTKTRSPWLGLAVFLICYAGVYFGLSWITG